MLAGIDEVDWASLGHAYGPADDVPALLRGLASPDPEVRESALDGLYGAVHHQGDVYDSTLACIPFLLELVADPAVQDRGGIVELLTSIGGIDLDGDDELDELGLDAEEFEDAANYAMAAAGVAAGAEVFFGLVFDADPEVRLAAPCALASLHPEPARVLTLLRERLTVETDTQVRLALVEAVGRIALRHESLHEETVDWLALVAQAARAPGLRLAALAQLARCAPDRLPPDVVVTVTGLLEEVRQEGRAEAARATRSDGGPPGRSLAEDRAPFAAYGEVPEAYAGYDGRPDAYDGFGAERDDPGEPAGRADVRIDFGVGIGMDVDVNVGPDVDADLDAGFEADLDADTGVDMDVDMERDVDVVGHPTLLGYLRALDGERRDGHITPWTDELLRTLHAALDDRVDDRIALVVAQLRSPDWGQRADAIWMCGGLIRVWRGRYEEVVRLVGEQLADPEPRVREAAAQWLEELFELACPAGDALAARVAEEDRPWVRERLGGRIGLGSALLALARSGDARAVPAIARALEQPDVRDQLLYTVPLLGPAAAPLAPALRRRLGEVELDDAVYDHAAPLLYALTALRAGQAAPEVLRVLRGAPAYRRDWVQESALRALAAFGPAAQEAVPDLRRLLESGTAPVATEAARALWSVTGEAAAVLPVLEGWLAPERDGADRRAAAAALGAIGPAAGGAAAALRRCLTARDLWLRVDGAAALWRVAGDAQAALPVLLTAWEQNRHTRVTVAECLAEMGPAAIAAAPLIRAELARRRRHNVVAGGTGSHDVHEDERLLTFCRAALARMERAEGTAGRGAGGA
ncbi:PBS lyase [Streptomyces sp. HUAS MG47]|uniref:PBS lyase n=1 Tax=Streptomyces solicamelliae TaxID=3231716 RepID=UPI003877DD8A